MASLTLKNLPDALLDALRRAAERDRRSLSQEITHLLEVAVRTEERPSAAEAQVAAWHRIAGRWQSDVDSATEQRLVRARRTRGRKVDM